MISTTALAIVTLLLTAAAHAAPAYAQSFGNQNSRFGASSHVSTLTIADESGAPVEGACVMIGDSPDVPFAGNTLTTDRGGHIVLPASWLTPEPVTIDAPGFVRATYFDLTPQGSILKLRRDTSNTAVPSPPASRFELGGDTSGFGQLKNDGIFDIGLVVQAVPRAQLSTLNLQTLISPEVDHFTVLGQSVDLPSNITIPDQTESYIFPLHFNKSSYRLFLPTPGAWQIAALHARVPFKTTIDALQSGKSIIDIVNTFEFIESSITPVTLTTPTQSQDLNVNQNIFTKAIEFKAPTYESSLNLLTIMLANTNGAYYPTDIKKVPSGSTVLLSAPAGAQTTGMVLAAFKKAGTKSIGAAADQYSAVTLPNNESRPFDPIRLVNPPQLNQKQLLLDTPAAGPDLNPVMTYGTLSVVTTVTRGKLNLETKKVLWDVWAPNWVNKLDLPTSVPPTIDPATQSLRWEVGFSAQFVGQKSIPPGPDALEKITHVSRSAVDL